MQARPKCEWCRHRIKPKPRGRPARYCSPACCQRAYERRQLTKRKQAEADAINAAKYPPWATHLHIKPDLPPQRRPRRKQCPVCKFPFVVKKRGPIPEVCGPRCARALELSRVALAVMERPINLFKKDVMANHRDVMVKDQERLRWQRRQATINDIKALIARQRGY